MTWNEKWTRDANCREVDPDRLFVRGAEQNLAKRICRDCPVVAECLAYALDHEMEYGVWGGMTERERRSILKRRPDVASWRTRLETARTEWEVTAEREAVVA